MSAVSVQIWRPKAAEFFCGVIVMDRFCEAVLIGDPLARHDEAKDDMTPQYILFSRSAARRHRWRQMAERAAPLHSETFKRRLITKSLLSKVTNDSEQWQGCQGGAVIFPGPVDIFAGPCAAADASRRSVGPARRHLRLRKNPPLR
jgi:hypothetical protein